MSRASSGSEVKLKLSIWPGLYLLHTPRHIGSVVHGIHEGPAPRSGKRLATTTANELTNMPSRHAGRGDCTRQAMLIERMKAGVFDTPAPERLAGHADSKRARPKRPHVQQQLLSPKKSQSLLPLVMDYANGLTQVEIARKHGMHVQTLRKRLHEAGVDTHARANALSDADLRSAQAAISDGASVRATARRLGVAHTTLQRALRRVEG